MGCRLLLVMFLARYLDLEALGAYGLVAGGAAVGPVLLGLGLTHLIARDAEAQDGGTVAGAMCRAWGIAGIGYTAILVVGIGFCAAGAAPDWLCLAVAVTFLEHINNDIFHVLSNRSRPLLANVAMFVRSAAWVIIYLAVAVAFPQFRSLEWVLVLWACGGFAGVAIFAAVTRRWLWRSAARTALRRSTITDALWRARLLYAADLAAVSGLYLDRYLVSLFLGIEAAGTYFLFWSVANAANTLVTMGVMQIQRPRLIRAWRIGGAASHRRLARSFANRTAVAAVAISTAIGLAFQVGAPLAGVLPVNTNISTIFWAVMAGTVVRTLSDFGAMAQYTAGLDAAMAMCNLATAVMSATFLTILVPVAGIAGAGAAAALAFTISGWLRLRTLPATECLQADQLDAAQGD
ncbi:Membrane protein involved in the export of O-antigen and teichoic acid [Azospirillum oryzae]|uniref:Membrane protein involved in the export of O-antigen and teichoic acid n=1 Tax=Azospirillum oryzae TaxID=286727 RepID=A0A1X7F1R2_9PROT|nr:Membrane protein involved in the export of O-antigen and teichoic acid [Azospirillum oryzae]